jgi:MOSC domain-containing protein YiiM/ribosomal protein S18 acetylase RimI-like enzyme
MSAPFGRVLQVNVSRGGVPKLPVAEAHVRRLGLDGDGHAEPTAHGGPHRAVALFAIEAIRRVAAEGHPIAPGTAGENLTTEGIELSTLPVGTRLAIGDRLVLEISGPDGPCSTIRGSFSDGRFARIGILNHPLDSRMYARVLRDGSVRPGDPIAVLPAEAGSRASELALLARLDAAHTASSLAMWRALAAHGVDLRIVAENEIAMCAEPGVRGGWWNGGLGFAWLPNMTALAIDHFSANDADGWLELDPDDEEARGLEPILTLDVLAATPVDVAPAGDASADVAPAGDASADDRSRIDGPPGVPEALRRGTGDDRLTIRSVGPNEAGAWAAVHSADGGHTEPAARWAGLARELSRAPHATLLLAELGGEPVGAAALHTHRKVGWLRAAAVVPAARGRGIQRALIAERARLAAEAGCDVLGAAVDPGGRSAVNLEGMGFRRVGARGHYRAGDAGARRSVGR